MSGRGGSGWREASNVSSPKPSSSVTGRRSLAQLLTYVNLCISVHLVQQLLIGGQVTFFLQEWLPRLVSRPHAPAKFADRRIFTIDSRVVR